MLLLISFLVLSSVFASPRDDFNSCKKTGRNCSYYKARVMESEGNSGSAMELYLDSGYYLDYIRLKTYYGDDISELLKKYNIDEKNSAYYLGLSEFVKGKWKNAIKYFSKDILSDHAPAGFYLGYSYLMLGDIDEAKSALDSKNDPESEKLRALILYAENKQLEAKRIFLNILKAAPDDLISLKYLAHIYYRTGWFEKAETIYSRLLNKEWRDTELYYLLSERCEMRIRYLKFDDAKKDADRIIKEYPKRKDFIAELVQWLLEYGNSSLAERYVAGFKPSGEYEESLRFFTQGLLQEFKINYKAALELFKKADAVYPSEEYGSKISFTENNLSVGEKDEAPVFKCDNYSVSRKKDGVWKVNFKTPDGK
ncbi:MAG: tetratricopeptide repeat protein, partial [Pseudomonadota bacterium]